jgi:hypothetical protein
MIKIKMRSLSNMFLRPETMCIALVKKLGNVPSELFRMISAVSRAYTVGRTPVVATKGRAVHRRVLGRLSRAMNRAAGGADGQTLCARLAEQHGSRCLFCRLVSWVTEPDHCANELAAWQRRGTTAAKMLRSR